MAQPSRHSTRTTARTAGSPAAAGRSTLRFVGVALAVLVAVIHLAEAPEYLEGTAYVGVLFIIGGVAMLAVAAALAVDRFTALAWTAGVLVCAGMIVGGVLSRTTGLPSFKEEEWEPLLLVSLVLEAAFLVVAAVRRRGARAR